MAIDTEKKEEGVREPASTVLRRTLEAAAFFIIALLAVSCNRPTSGSQAEAPGTKAMAEIVNRGERMAEAAEGRALGAWQLSRIAMSTRGDLNGLFREAYDAIDSVRDEEALNYAQALRLKSQGWPRAMVQRAAAAALRIENASSRVWPMRAVASELVGVNKAKASRMLMEAAKEAGDIDDPEYRDAQLVAIASEMARINPSRAEQTAALIVSPYFRARALVSIGAQRRDLRILRKALLEAEKIEPPVAGASGDEERDGTSLLYQKAVLMAGAAVQMHDAGAANDSMLDAIYEAVDAADSIEAPRGRAYAYLAVASLAAPLNVPAAANVASMIEDKYPVALCEARTAIAVEMARRSEQAGVRELEAVIAIASGMKDTYERQRALGRAISVLAGLRPKEAARYLFESEGGRELLWGYSPEGSEALEAVVFEVAAGDEKVLRGLIEKYSPGDFVKARLYMRFAEGLAEKDGKKAEEYFRKALGASRKAGSTYLIWKTAALWSRHDPERILKLMARLEDHGSPYAASSTMDLALGLRQGGEEGYALEAYRLALNKALDITEPFARSEALRDLSVRGRRIDEATSRSAFEKAVEAARELGSP
jgi:hypothetical protein